MPLCVAVMYVLCSATEPSLVPRPSAPPAFDRFQYARTEWKRSKAGGAEGLGTRLTEPLVFILSTIRTACVSCKVGGMLHHSLVMISDIP